MEKLCECHMENKSFVLAEVCANGLTNIMENLTRTEKTNDNKAYN